MNFCGVFAPIPTPFVDDELDLGALRDNLARWMETDLAGIVVLGTNGESAQVNDNEADQLIATTRTVMPAGRVVIAGTGRESTRATVTATRRAADAGADAVLVRTPSFFKRLMTEEALIRHYTVVADAAPIPVLLYNFSAATGVNLSPIAVGKLSEHPNIIGIKESGGSIEQVGDLVVKVSPGFSVLVGSAPTFFASLCVGAIGGILALAAVQPALCVKLLQLVQEHKFDQALVVQRQLTQLANLVTTVYGVPGLKAALDLTGYYGGPPRHPLLPVRPEGLDQIREAIALISEEIHVGL
jgi:4-hydroxy-2-oxoglutarate aldolase